MELEGFDLDLAVAKVIGLNFDIGVSVMSDKKTKFLSICDDEEDSKFSPSTNWAQGGPLIEKYGISIEIDLDDKNEQPEKAWFATIQDKHKWIPGYRGAYEEKSRGLGSTPLEAAMRALVKALDKG